MTNYEIHWELISSEKNLNWLSNLATFDAPQPKRVCRWISKWKKFCPNRRQSNLPSNSNYKNIKDVKKCVCEIQTEASTLFYFVLKTSLTP